MKPPAERLSAPINAADLDLLRTFEPVVLYTRGEQFYPTDVEHYVAESSLWEHSPEGRDTLLVKQGEMSLQNLSEHRPADFGTIRYLRFVESLNLIEAAEVIAQQVALRQKLGNRFHAGIGRLARGGFLPRLVD